MRATSWSGSETKRREQGGVAHAPTADSRDNAVIYAINPGTPVGLQTAGETDWQPYITRKRVESKLCEFSGQYAIVVFQGWKIRVIGTSLVTLNEPVSRDRGRDWMRRSRKHAGSNNRPMGK